MERADAVGIATLMPSVGRGAFGSTCQTPGVDAGHAMEVGVGLYALMATPVGWSVAHCVCRLAKSGCTGVGVPLTTTPPAGMLKSEEFVFPPP